MKFLLVFLVLFPCAFAYEITKLGGIEGEIQQVEFDSNSNTYIRSVTYIGLTHFYKLDSHGQILVQHDYYFMEKIIVNSKGDCYVDVYPGIVGYHELHLLKSDSTDIEYLFTFKHANDEPYHNQFFLDEDDNCIFNTGNGVVLLRPEENIPRVIKNLEGFIFDKYDKDGREDIYLLNSQLSDWSIAEIPKDGRTAPLPYGAIFQVENKITDFKIWRNTSFTVEHPSDNIASIHFASSYELLSQYDVNYYFANITTDERLFILENSTITNTSHLYFVNLDLEVVNVVRNLNSSIFKMNDTIAAVDNEGTAYFAYYYDAVHKVLRLKYNETEVSEIVVPTEEDIFDLEVDGDDNLWILADELYVLEKGKDLPELISDGQLETNVSSFFRVKKGRNEVYIGAINGLFISIK